MLDIYFLNIKGWFTILITNNKKISTIFKFVLLVVFILNCSCIKEEQRLSTKFNINFIAQSLLDGRGNIPKECVYIRVKISSEEWEKDEDIVIPMDEINENSYTVTILKAELAVFNAYAIVVKDSVGNNDKQKIITYYDEKDIEITSEYVEVTFNMKKNKSKNKNNTKHKIIKYNKNNKIKGNDKKLKLK